MTTTPPRDAPDTGDDRAPDPGAVWDERYAATVWPEAPDETLADLVTPLRAGRALDLGCGPEDRAGFFARAVAAVAPGGHCYVVGHHLDSLGLAGPPHAERLLTEGRLVALLDPLPVQASRQL
ncbi:MAG: hypothetical protein M0T71_11545, partial [Actinomycetota bacterium]|nr:hypothetical protein [Actinomycetota bacterium]